MRRLGGEKWKNGRRVGRKKIDGEKMKEDNEKEMEMKKKRKAGGEWKDARLGR